jgi:hypothetical protein
MESAAKVSGTARQVRTRRAMLAGVVGGLGVWVASAAQRVMPAEAAVGDPIRIGRINGGGGSSTELRAASSKPVFRAVQSGSGTALRGQATTGRAVMGTAGSNGTGLYGSSPNHNGVFGSSDTGDGVTGVSRTGKGVRGSSQEGAGVWGFSEGGPGVYGECQFDDAIFGFTDGGAGVHGYSLFGKGVFGESDSGYAGYFAGNTYVGTLDMPESTPGLPPDGQIRLFARDNGSGKAQLCVQFATGGPIVLATEA